MNGKHILVFFFFSVLFAVISVSFSAHPFQTYKLTALPQVVQELSWEIQDSQPESVSESEPEPTLSVILQHVDNINYQSLDPSTPESLFQQLLRRDALRTKMIARGTNASKKKRPRNISSSIISGYEFGIGEYFTRIGVGTPPKYVYMILDTGSDIVWLQCSPCEKCYKQIDPIFDPKKSSSFSVVKCGNLPCGQVSTHCNNKTKLCQYEVPYGDGSFTNGDLSKETLKFRNTNVPNVTLGCGHDNEGLFESAAGLLGLGLGNLSFPVQFGKQFRNVFSYCLGNRYLDSSVKSTLMFGKLAVSRKAVFTKLLRNPNPERYPYYYVPLLGFSVGGKLVRGIKKSMLELDRINGKCGTIVDSGTSVTRLNKPAYEALREAFRVAASHLKRGPDFLLFDTCYNLSGKSEVKVPTVVLHFRGANVSLPASNYLIPVDSDGKFCFAFAATEDRLSIIGNIQQQGFRVSFDLEKNRVGFASSPNGCT